MTRELFYIKRQKFLCEKYGVSFDQVEKLNSDIIGLANNGIKKNTLDLARLAVKDVQQGMMYWLSIHGLTSREVKEMPQEKSLLDLFSYLLVVEGIFSKVVQIIAFMLMENDHDVFDSIRNEFITEFEELEKIDLAVKLKFLRKHGFLVLTDSVDRKLRNDIAHLNLAVKPDGKIIDKKSGTEIKNIVEKMDHIGCLCAISLLTLNYLLDEQEKKMKLTDAKT